MARSLRVEYAGAYYHVGWMVHAWVIMANHYHVFIDTPEANLVEGMNGRRTHIRGAST